MTMSVLNIHCRLAQLCCIISNPQSAPLCRVGQAVSCYLTEPFITHKSSLSYASSLNSCLSSGSCRTGPSIWLPLVISRPRHFPRIADEAQHQRFRSTPSSLQGSAMAMKVLCKSWTTMRRLLSRVFELEVVVALLDASVDESGASWLVINRFPAVVFAIICPITKIGD